MGRDKGLLLKDGIPWARHMADKLTPFQIPVVFSVNALQLDAYSAFVPAAAMVTDNAAVSGPLKGLLSVHAQFPHKDLLLLACDMLDVDMPAIDHLIASYSAGGYELYAYRESDLFQPFCAVYTAAGVEHGMQEPSLQRMLRQGKTKSLAILRSEAFRNYNTL